MPLNVTGNLDITIRAVESLVVGLGSGQLAPTLAVSLAFGNGTGSGNIQWTFSKSATAAAAPVTYTLSALVDDQGRTIVLAKVRAFVIAHMGSVDGQPLLVGGAATNPWAAPFGSATDRQSVRAGGVYAFGGPLATAYPVVAGSSDQLKVDPGANTIPFKLMFLGE
jgi:hypothetical protein